jgi:hypothetical protein
VLAVAVIPSVLELELDVEVPLILVVWVCERVGDWGCWGGLVLLGLGGLGGGLGGLGGGRDMLYCKGFRGERVRVEGGGVRLKWVSEWVSACMLECCVRACVGFQFRFQFPVPVVKQLGAISYMCNGPYIQVYFTTNPDFSPEVPAVYSSLQY